MSEGALTMAKMTIATALRHIKALKNKIATESQRMTAGVLFDADAAPAFAFEAAFEARRQLVVQLVSLERQVAEKNATCRLDGGEGPLAIEAIRKLQELKSLIALLNGLPTQAQAERIVKSETLDWDYATNPPRRVKIETQTRFICKLPEVEKANMIDKLKADFESLNARLESFNHSTHVESN